MRFVPLLAVLLTCGHSVALRAQDNVPAESPVPVFLTVSGAISKGSHQAGVNWALLHLIRNSSDPDFRARHDFPTRGYSLGGLTGASAGNFTAVLTALEWCRAVGEPDPRLSLFWRHWIPTGFTDLVPEDADAPAAEPDAGLVDRARFRNSHLPMMRAFIAGEEAPLRDCAVPIGITVTRRGLDSAHVFNALHIPMTRYATTFEVRTDSLMVGAGRLQFRPFAPDTQIAHFGERLWPAPLDPATGYSMDAIFDFVSASAAFPIAFAPQRLRFVKDANCLFGGCAPDSAFFLDGGVFDNNPVDLTIGIRRRTVAAGTSLTIFIDPDYRRSPVRGAGAGASAPVIAPGLAGMANTVHALVLAGRAAELYAVAKAVDLDSATFDMPSHPLTRTDREFVIAGAELGDFGAFLGRPLRAFDFYVGIYDGLVFAAQQMAIATPPTAGNAGSATHAAAVLALIEDEAVIAFATDRTLLRKLWAIEFASDDSAAGTLRGRSRGGAAEAFDARVLEALLDGSVAAMRADSTPPCSARGLLSAFYCRSALPYFVAATASHRDLLDTIVSTSAPEGSLVDKDFARFVHAPQERLQAYANRLIARLYQNERAAGSDGWAQAASAAGLYFNQITLGERRSVFEPRDLLSVADPSTVPSDLNRLRCFRCWVPYRITVFPGLSGVEAEYRPTLRLPRGVGLHATLTPWVWHRPEPSLSVDEDFGVLGHDAARTYWAVGTGVVWQRGTPIFNAVEAGWRVFRPYNHGLKDLGTGYVSALDLSGQFLLGRLQFGVRYFHDNWGHANERVGHRWGGPTTLNAGMPFAFYVAMPDVPGLLYWFLPR